MNKCIQKGIAKQKWTCLLYAFIKKKKKGKSCVYVLRGYVSFTWASFNSTNF